MNKILMFLIRIMMILNFSDSIVIQIILILKTILVLLELFISSNNALKFLHIKIGCYFRTLGFFLLSSKDLLLHLPSLLKFLLQSHIYLSTLNLFLSHPSSHLHSFEILGFEVMNYFHLFPISLSYYAFEEYAIAKVNFQPSFTTLQSLPSLSKN